MTARKRHIAACKNSTKNSAVSIDVILIHNECVPIAPTAFAEKYRDDLRRRDETIRTLNDAAGLHEIEVHKFQREIQALEERLQNLETEYNHAMEAHTELDEQKQENLLLKETIDRLRFEMDEMRASASAAVPGASSGTSSATNTMSKSLGAELAGKMKWMDEDEGAEDLSSDTSTAVEDEDETAGEEEEDVIQTIITKRKRVCLSQWSIIFIILNN